MISFACVYSQELDATVSINTEKLENKYRDILANFPQTVQNYLNTNRFSTINPWDGEKIKCTFFVVFLSASDSKYTASVVVTSQRPLYGSQKDVPIIRINDPAWEFEYQIGQPLYFGKSNFESLTSFLDYYANLIIGMDLDSWYVWGGNDFYTKALNIVTLATSSTFKNGWAKSSEIFTRQSFLEDLTSEKFSKFREGFFSYHYYGVDYYANPSKIAEGQKNIIKLINTIQQDKDKLNLQGPLMRMFFEVKNSEICEYLKDYPDKTIYATLKTLDPAHINKYSEYETK